MKVIVLFLSIITIACVSNTEDGENSVNGTDAPTQEELDAFDEEASLLYQDDCSTQEQCVAMQDPIIQMQLFQTNDTSPDSDVKDNPKQLIENANAKALQEPVQSTIQNSLVLYNYYDKYIYSIYTTPQRVTVLRFDKKELIDGEIVVGDSANWMIEIDTAVDRPLVYIKPLLSNLTTNMVINTTKRTYYLSLESNKKTFMVAVEWRYPMEILKSTQKKKQLLEEPMLLKDLNFNYRIISYGKEPSWKPNKVFDNGERTFIQFFSKYHVAKAPALFTINALGKSTLVNYRVIGDYYIVDSLFQKAELRLGSKKEDSILIVKGMEQ